MMQQFNRERVTSLLGKPPLDMNSAGQPMYGGLDKLACVTDMHDWKKNLELKQRLLGLASSGDYLIKVRPAGKYECGGHYRWVVEIRLKAKSRKHPILLAIHFAPTSSQRGFQRMELSPQHYSAKQITDLFVWLGRKGRIGKYLYRGLRNAWITTIHYALDVVGMKIHDYLIRLVGARSGDFNDLHGEQEGLRLGSTTIVASIYEKADAPGLATERRYEQAVLLLDEQQFRRFLRLELRLSPGKKKLMLNNLLRMENLVSKLAFYDRNALVDSELEPDFSRLLREYVPYPVARADYQPSASLNGKQVSPAKKAADKRVDKLMERYRVELFDSEAVWAMLPLVVAKLGILAQPQYWQFKHRQKWLQLRLKDG
ncbi:TPA: hypothetical protein G9B13_000944 [Salmonella enterica]|uniref:Replication initiation protein n=1 Tax=Salmonella enterica TaxID=28901 RepID=A0A743GU47_SALER|nr:hypothetical protein [Citrobacter freundii]EIK4857306.1 hypothetical protein [Salmonella enterica]WFW92835.1 hypothetical protein NFJ87_05350 [Citrobacter freundii]HAF1690091.1 hypothetical protein [Salmonella enterica]HAF1985338.1 hypothetical protein [Salmonella enterica]HAF4408237.1 hypothetical protein [Salmonella enterica]